MPCRRTDCTRYIHLLLCNIVKQAKAGLLHRLISRLGCSISHRREHIQLPYCMTAGCCLFTYRNIRLVIRCVCRIDVISAVMNSRMGWRVLYEPVRILSPQIQESKRHIPVTYVPCHMKQAEQSDFNLLMSRNTIFLFKAITYMVRQTDTDPQ